MKSFIQQVPALDNELRRLCTMACRHRELQAQILCLQRQGSPTCSWPQACDLQDNIHLSHDQSACAAAVHELIAWPRCSCRAHPDQMHLLARALTGMMQAHLLPSYDQDRIQTGKSLTRAGPDSGKCNGEELCFYGATGDSEFSGMTRCRPPSPLDRDASMVCRENSSNQRPCIFVGGGRDYSWRGSCCGLRYSPGDDVWSPAGPTLRDGVTFASVASIGNTVYMFCNSQPPVCSVVGSDGSWQSLPVHNFHAGLQFAAVEAVGGEIWVAGGRSLPNKVFSAPQH